MKKDPMIHAGRVNQECPLHPGTSQPLLVGASDRLAPTLPESVHLRFFHVSTVVTESQAV